MAQASALMPMIQFSKGPRHLDAGAQRLIQDISKLHIDFSPIFTNWLKRAL